MERTRKPVGFVRETIPPIEKLIPKEVKEVKADPMPIVIKAEPLPSIVEIPKELEVIPVVVRPILKYCKIGGGQFSFKKRIYKKGDVFYAYPEEILPGFKNIVECLSDVETQKASVQALVKVYEKELLYVKIPAKTIGFFDVINSITKKSINEKALSILEAEILCNALNL